MTGPAPHKTQLSPMVVQVRDLGRRSYLQAMAIQRQHHEQIAATPADERPGVLLLVEHDPVITVSRRRGAGGHLLADAARLAELGIEVQPTDRGGDVTYHGPGQQVAYPILPLGRLRMTVGRYMRWLEDWIIEVVGQWGATGRRMTGMTGVWCDDPRGRAPAAKLCAMGVRVQRQVSLHGVALNVDPDLSHFATIVPCGLAGWPVTSLRELLGDAAPGMAEVRAAMAATFIQRLTAAPSPLRRPQVTATAAAQTSR